MAGAAVFDFARLVRRLGGDRDIAGEGAELFVETVPEMMAEIDRAAAGDNAGDLERAVHTLRGALGNISAERSADVAAEIETLARRGGHGAAVARLDALRAEMTMLEDALARVTAGPSRRSS